MFDSPPMPTVKSLTKVNREPGKQGLQRLAMLNKLFMKNITDLMSTGTVAMEIVGRGIEISKVSSYCLYCLYYLVIEKGKISVVVLSCLKNLSIFSSLSIVTNNKSQFP